MACLPRVARCQKAIKAYVTKHSVEVLKKRYDKAVAKWEKAAAKAKEAGKRAPRKPRPFQTPGDLSNRRIGNLYRRFIRPLIPYGIKGVLWDQGESGTRVMELDQYTIMGALIKGWRNEWGQGEFPFLYIQKPSGGGVAWDKEANKTTRMADKFAGLPKGQTKDGNYRELHIRIMAYPNTAMVTCIDLGPGIHPINKSGYGARACQVALGHVYEKKVAIYGPIYGSHKIEGNKIRITFNHVGQGLAFKYGDKLQGFAIAGEDKVFHWAESVIAGNDVIVSSVKVAAPVAVRFGWARRRAWANLFNKDGLPALSFRTDSW